MSQNDSSAFLHQLLSAVGPVLSQEMRPTVFPPVPCSWDRSTKEREDALLQVAIDAVMSCEDHEDLPDLSSRIAMLVLFTEGLEPLRDKMLRSLFS